MPRHGRRARHRSPRPFGRVSAVEPAERGRAQGTGGRRLLQAALAQGRARGGHLHGLHHRGRPGPPRPERSARVPRRTRAAQRAAAGHRLRDPVARGQPLLGPEVVPVHPHALLHLAEEVLLGADDAARAADADVGQRLARGETEVLHVVARDQHPRAPQARLAVDRQGPRLRLGDVDEAAEDGVRGAAPVREVELVHAHAPLLKAPRLVELLVEAHDALHVVALEVGHVVLGHVDAPVVVRAPGLGAAEGQELAREDPVHVAVLHALAPLVLVRVELRAGPVEVDVTHGRAPLQAPQAVQHREAEGRGHARGVPEGREGLERLEAGVGGLGGLLHVEHEVGPQQHRAVGPRVRAVAGVDVHGLAPPALPRLGAQLRHPPAEPRGAREVERAKVLVESLVDQLVVRAPREVAPGHRRRPGGVEPAHRRHVQPVVQHGGRLPRGQTKSFVFKVYLKVSQFLSKRLARLLNLLLVSM